MKVSIRPIENLEKNATEILYRAVAIKIEKFWEKTKNYFKNGLRALAIPVVFFILNGCSIVNEEEPGYIGVRMDLVQYDNTTMDSLAAKAYLFYKGINKIYIYFTDKDNFVAKIEYKDGVVNSAYLVHKDGNVYEIKEGELDKVLQSEFNVAPSSATWAGEAVLEVTKPHEEGGVYKCTVTIKNLYMERNRGGMVDTLKLTKPGPVLYFRQTM